MASSSNIRWVFAAALTFIALPAIAAPLSDSDDWQRNGALSRHLWSPDLARHNVMGLQVSAGVALGLQGAAQTQMRRSVTPALSLDVGNSSRLTVLPGGRRGAMLVLHSTR